MDDAKEKDQMEHEIIRVDLNDRSQLCSLQKRVHLKMQVVNVYRTVQWGDTEIGTLCNS